MPLDGYETREALYVALVEMAERYPGRQIEMHGRMPPVRHTA